MEATVTVSDDSVVIELNDGRGTVQVNLHEDAPLVMVNGQVVA